MIAELELVLPTTFATDIPIHLPNPPSTSRHAQVPTFTSISPSTRNNSIELGDKCFP